MLHAFCDTVRERREHHTRHLGELRLHPTCHIEGIVIRITRHTDDQIDMRRLQHTRCLFCSRYLRKGRRIAKSQFHVFVVDFLLNPSVVFQHEGVIGIGYNQHVIDAAHHQVDKRHIFQQELVPLLGYRMAIHSSIFFRAKVVIFIGSAKLSFLFPLFLFGCSEESIYFCDTK